MSNADVIVRESFINQFKLVHKLIVNFLTSKLIRFSFKVAQRGCYWRRMNEKKNGTVFSLHKTTVNLCENPKKEIFDSRAEHFFQEKGKGTSINVNSSSFSKQIIYAGEHNNEQHTIKLFAFINALLTTFDIASKSSVTRNQDEMF